MSDRTEVKAMAKSKGISSRRPLGARLLLSSSRTTWMEFKLLGASESPLVGVRVLLTVFSNSINKFIIATCDELPR